MEELGGLARRMPITWIGFLIGAAAIIGIPPFNGFVSEWLVYQGLFGAGQTRDSLRLGVLAIPALALIGALALACFAKVAGVVFLGTPRSSRAASATEVGRGLFLPALVLAAACVAIGVVPALGIAAVRNAAGQLAGAGPSTVFLDAAISGGWMISLVALVTILLCALLWALRRYLMRHREPRFAETWGCGYGVASPRMQYTASSFASPLLSLFGAMTGVRVERSAAALRTHPSDLVLDDVALPAWRAVHRAALRLRLIQQGRLYLYLIYVMAALLVLLAYLAFGLRL
jgi:NADH:ubiquinone oxidoreductase subunit 5 (subunit L)/multisubunit Na+/H+ antiporter MnhA subunit